jgi:hypothetical protein
VIPLKVLVALAKPLLIASSNPLGDPAIISVTRATLGSAPIQITSFSSYEYHPSNIRKYYSNVNGKITWKNYTEKLHGGINNFIDKSGNYVIKLNI